MIGLLKALTVLAVYWYFDVIQQNLTEVKLDWSTRVKARIPVITRTHCVESAKLLVVTVR